MTGERNERNERNERHEGGEKEPILAELCLFGNIMRYVNVPQSVYCQHSWQMFPMNISVNRNIQQVDGDSTTRQNIGHSSGDTKHRDSK